MNEKENILSNCPPKIIFDKLKEIENVLIKEINKVSTPITDNNFEIIKKIADEYIDIIPKSENIYVFN